MTETQFGRLERERAEAKRRRLYALAREASGSAPALEPLHARELLEPFGRHVLGCVTSWAQHKDVARRAAIEAAFVLLADWLACYPLPEHAGG